MREPEFFDNILVKLIAVILFISFIIFLWFLIDDQIISWIITSSQSDIAAQGFYSVFVPVGITILVVVLFSLVALGRQIRISKLQKEERLESLREGGIEEPHQLRHLTKEEAQILHDKHKTAKKIVEHIWWVLPLFALVDFVFLYNLYTLGPTAGEDLPGLMVGIFFFVLVIEASVVGIALKEVPLYLDLRSPVFRVQGRAIKEKVKRKNSTSYYITVRGLKYSEENYHLLPDFFEMIKDEEEVAVEYSPRTKEVWHMHVTEDI